MRKKILSLALALVMGLGLALSASAYDMGKAGASNTVSVGFNWTAFLDADGALWTFGNNLYSNLGNGSKKDSVTPVKVMDNVAAFSCGSFYAATIKTDGSLWMWGLNSRGQLGNGGGSNDTVAGFPIQTVPVKVMDSVAAVSCGSDHTAAIKTDGSLWMWGSNEYGQLGNGGGGNSMNNFNAPYQTVPVKVMDGVTAVSCGAIHTAVIKTDGSLWTWGYSEYGQLGNGGSSNATNIWDNPIQTVPVKVMDGVAAVSCGGSHTAAIKTDGSLWMWGSNEYGQLGNSGSVNTSVYPPCQTVPVKVMDSVAAVSCGDYHVATVKTDGSLWMWGDNSDGQLGNGGMGNATNSVGYTYQTVPVKMMDSVAAVSCGTNHTAAIKTDGSLWTWGSNFGGRLGYEGGNATNKYGTTIQTVPKQVEGVTVAVSPKAPTSPTASTTTPDTTMTGFSDVPTTAYYAKPVAWAVEKGVTAGTSATTFSPNATCTQGQILTFLWRAKGEPKPAGTVNGTQYYATAAQWAKEQGLTENFSAEADCTRSMVVTSLWKLAGSPKAGTSTFSDVSANADYAQAVAWAVEQGITSGTSATTFSPDVTCSRGQIVTFLYRAFAK